MTKQILFSSSLTHFSNYDKNTNINTPVTIPIQQTKVVFLCSFISFFKKKTRKKTATHKTDGLSRTPEARANTAMRIEHTSTSNVRSLSSKKMTRSRSLVSLETRDMVAKPPKPPNLRWSSSMATSLSVSQEEHSRPSISAAIPRAPHPTQKKKKTPAALRALPSHPLRRDPRLPLRMLDGALTLLFPQTEHWGRQRRVCALSHTHTHGVMHTAVVQSCCYHSAQRNMQKNHQIITRN